MFGDAFVFGDDVDVPDCDCELLPPPDISISSSSSLPPSIYVTCVNELN